MTRRDRLYVSVVRDLEARIRGGSLGPGEKLPSEPELARKFGVSRMTVREALGYLENQGLIAKRHGIGSFVMGADHEVAAGLEKMESFTETIRRSGHEAADRVISIDPVRLPKSMGVGGSDSQAEAGYRITSLRTSDGIPVILTIDTIRGDLLRGRESVLEARARYESLIEFLDREMGIRPCYSVMNLAAVEATEEVAELLRVPRGYPLVHLDGVVRDRSGGPIYHSSSFIRSDKYSLALVRRS
ncbi:MAG: GntR family transcriptional regulator [Firmicutes bacterium]|nr:GntR family transcriptional regulator [Bacillota bacterium]